MCYKKYHPRRIKCDIFKANGLNVRIKLVDAKMLFIYLKIDILRVSNVQLSPMT